VAQDIGPEFKCSNPSTTKKERKKEGRKGERKKERKNQVW
jgi:hypothetical protein